MRWPHSRPRACVLDARANQGSLSLDPATAGAGNGLSAAFDGWKVKLGDRVYCDGREGTLEGVVCDDRNPASPAGVAFRRRRAS